MQKESKNKGNCKQKLIIIFFHLHFEQISVYIRTTGENMSVIIKKSVNFYTMWLKWL